MLASVVLNCMLLLGTGVPGETGAVGETRVVQMVPDCSFSLFDSTQLRVSSQGHVYILVGYLRERVRCYHLHEMQDGQWSETTVALPGDPWPIVKAATAGDRYYLYTFAANKLKVYRTLGDIGQDRPLWQAAAEEGVDGEMLPVAPDRGDVLLLSSQRCLTSNPLAWFEHFRSFGHGGYAQRLCTVLIRNAQFQNMRWRPGLVENMKSEYRGGWLLEKERLHLAWGREKAGCFYATINLKDNSWQSPVLLSEGRCKRPSLGRQGESIYCALDRGRIDVVRITGGKVTLWPGEQYGCGPRLVPASDGKLLLFWLNERGVNCRWCTEDGAGPVYRLPGPVDPDRHHFGSDAEPYFDVAADASGDIHILSAQRYDMYETPREIRAGHEPGLEVRYTLLSAEAVQKMPSH